MPNIPIEEIDYDPHYGFEKVMRLKFPFFKKGGPVYDILVSNEFGHNSIDSIWANWYESYELDGNWIDSVDGEEFEDHLAKLIRTEISETLGDVKTFEALDLVMPECSRELIAVAMGVA